MTIDYRKIYLLIDTEFKKTEQKLGKLCIYAKTVSQKITKIENDLLHKINTEKHNKFYEINETTEIVNLIKTFSQNKEEHSIMKLYEKYICILKENERIAKYTFQMKQEDFDFLTLNIKDKYENDIICHSEFKAIICSHKIMFQPYIHILYFVLKYDVISKNIYFDIFISNTQFIKYGSIKQKSFVPKMFDENDICDCEFIDLYSRQIYYEMKNILNDVYLIDDALNKLNKYIYNESGEKCEEKDYITLKIQKHFVEFLEDKIPTNDSKIKTLLSLPTETNMKYKDIYKKILQKTKKIVEEKKMLENKSYTVISTSLNLLKENIIYEKEGEEDKHAESILVNKNYKNQENMFGFKNNDIIFVIRLYQNGSIGSGLPCNRCVRVLHGNGINKVIYSIDKNNYKIIDMNDITYTYTTTGNKLLNIDLYLYGDYIVRKRLR